MARYALEVIPATEATDALVSGLGAAPDELKVGIASSLGARARGGKKVDAAAFAPLVTNQKAALIRAGALALGAVGSPEAAKVLSSASASDADAAARAAVSDGLLECAENLLAGGDKDGAKAAYEKILASDPSGVVKKAASLGIAASS